MQKQISPRAPELLAAYRRASQAPGGLQDTADTGHVDPIARRFDQAIERLEAGDWSEAFAELCALANQGHPPASRIALMLAGRGTALFGGTFPATAQDKTRWQQNGE